MKRQKCPHHWLLAAPEGGVVRGRCKRCGDVREWPAEPKEPAWMLKSRAAGAAATRRRYE